MKLRLANLLNNSRIEHVGNLLNSFVISSIIIQRKKVIHAGKKCGLKHLLIPFQLAISRLCKGLIQTEIILILFRLTYKKCNGFPFPVGTAINKA